MSDLNVVGVDSDVVVERKKSVPSERFLEVWMDVVDAQGTVQDVANRLEMDFEGTYQRSLKLRSLLKTQGVLLPTLKRTDKPKKARVDVSALARMVAARNLAALD